MVWFYHFNLYKLGVFQAGIPKPSKSTEPLICWLGVCYDIGMILGLYSLGRFAIAWKDAWKKVPTILSHMVVKNGD